MNSVREYAPYIDRTAYSKNKLVLEEDIQKLFHIMNSSDSIYDEIIPVKIEYINSEEVGDTNMAGVPFIVWDNKRLCQGSTYQLSLRDAATIVYDYATGADLKLNDSSITFSQNISSSHMCVSSPTNRLATLSNQHIDIIALSEEEEQTYSALLAKSKNRGVVKVNVVALPSIYIDQFVFLQDAFFIQ